MTNPHPGVTFFESDRHKGPFIIRISGTSNFVTSVQTGYYSRWGTPGKKVVIEQGWDNKNNLSFDTIDEALKVADQVWKLEGFRTSIEAMENHENR